MKYYTEKEVQDFKNGSINFPMIIIEKEQDEVIEVSEVVSISGINLKVPIGIPFSYSIVSSSLAIKYTSSPFLDLGYINPCTPSIVS